MLLGGRPPGGVRAPLTPRSARAPQGAARAPQGAARAPQGAARAPHHRLPHEPRSTGSAAHRCRGPCGQTWQSQDEPDGVWGGLSWRWGACGGGERVPTSFGGCASSWPAVHLCPPPLPRPDATQRWASREGSSWPSSGAGAQAACQTRAMPAVVEPSGRHRGSFRGGGRGGGGAHVPWARTFAGASNDASDELPSMVVSCPRNRVGGALGGSSGLPPGSRPPPAPDLTVSPSISSRVRFSDRRLRPRLAMFEECAPPCARQFVHGSFVARARNIMRDAVGARQTWKLCGRHDIVQDPQWLPPRVPAPPPAFLRRCAR